MHASDDLLQAQPLAPQRRVQAEPTGETLIDGEPVGPQIPVPGADDGPGRQLDALNVLARQGLADAQAILGIVPLGDVVEENGDAAVCRRTYPTARTSNQRPNACA